MRNFNAYKFYNFKKRKKCELKCRFIWFQRQEEVRYTSSGEGRAGSCGDVIAGIVIYYKWHVMNVLANARNTSKAFESFGNMKPHWHRVWNSCIHFLLNFYTALGAPLLIVVYGLHGGLCIIACGIGLEIFFRWFPRCTLFCLTLSKMKPWHKCDVFIADAFEVACITRYMYKDNTDIHMMLWERLRWRLTLFMLSFENIFQGKSSWSVPKRA